MAVANKQLIERDFDYADYVRKLIQLINGKLNSNFGIPVRGTALKVIVPCSDWGVSGVNTVIEEFGKSLIQLGWDFRILFTRPERVVRKGLTIESDDSDPIELSMPDVPFEFLTRVQPKYSKLWRSLIGYFESQAPCIFLSGYEYSSNAISPALSNDIGVIGWNQSDDAEYYEQAARLGRYWNAMICVSSGILKKVHDVNPLFSKRAEIIYNAVGLKGGQPKEKPHGTINIVYTGRIIQYQKRILDFIELCQSLDAIGVSYKLTLCGPDHDGSTGILQRTLSQEIESKKVVITGRLSKEEIHGILKGAHFFALLSEFEGMPVSLLEAMSFGCVPIIYGMESGVKELIVDRKNGLIVDSRNYVEWAQIISDVASSAEFEVLSRNAWQTIQDEFTLQKSVEKLDALLRKVGDEMLAGEYERPDALVWKSKFGDVLPPQNIITVTG